MHRLMESALVVLAAFPGVASAAVGEPALRVRSSGYEVVEAPGALGRHLDALMSRLEGPAWAGWAVPVVDGDRIMCCLEGNFERLRGKDGSCGTCLLEKRRGVFMSNDVGQDDPLRLEPADHFFLLVRIEDGAVGDLRAISPDCAIDTGALPFVRLEGVSMRESLVWLDSLVDSAAPDRRKHGDLVDEAVTAIALHDDPVADDMLDRLARGEGRPAAQNPAIFWLGEARGRHGYETLTRLLRGDGDGDQRKKVVFALTQSPLPEAIDRILDAARTDRSPEVRAEALFWLAQEAADRAVGALKEAVEKDPEDAVRRAAVFALTQLPEERGVPLLIDVAKTHASPAIRREAIFWLGQAEDPRALEFIASILEP